MVVSHVDMVEALLRRLGAIAGIGLNRLGVGQDCILPTAHPHVDVRRHVHQMTQPRLQVAEAVGRRDRSLRLG